ncbi:hypothetical protein CRX42_32125, partial [Pseudomonas jessenii]
GAGLLAKAVYQSTQNPLNHRQKKPRSSRDRIEAEGTVEELPCEGDQTFVKRAESSVPPPQAGKLPENDLFIANAAIATNRPCRHPAPPPESNHDPVP